MIEGIAQPFPADLRTRAATSAPVDLRAWPAAAAPPRFSGPSSACGACWARDHVRQAGDRSARPCRDRRLLARTLSDALAPAAQNSGI